MESLSTELIITFTLYSFFGFYLKKWSLDFRDQSFLFETFLTWFMGLASTFGVGFLIYFGYKFGWLLALIFHMLNGLRHLFWDIGIGLSLNVAKWTGIIVCISTIFLVFIMGFYFLGLII